MVKTLCILSLFILFAYSDSEKTVVKNSESVVKRLTLDIDAANEIVQLPLACFDIEYPNKLNQVIGSEDDLNTPKALHPAFYGCFDWHSAVHGHWSLVRMVKLFPELENAENIINGLNVHLSKENIEKEIKYFNNEINNGFERMYGWAWLLKLSDELRTWNHPQASILEKNLNPLSEIIVDKVIEFLPKLNYPIRVGTHTNTAFALTMIYDYAVTVENDKLKSSIEQRAMNFYFKDADCPLTWEPSGYDFLSPCLEEADLMRRVLSKDDFRTWVAAFLPELYSHDIKLEPGIVSDREDGHLVHLDGLNYSRAWCLYGIAETLPEYGHLVQIANEHINHSLPSLIDGNYEGGHWLASFALLALSSQE